VVFDHRTSLAPPHLIIATLYPYMGQGWSFWPFWSFRVLVSGASLAAHGQLT
jgi:hypothetical protein